MNTKNSKRRLKRLEKSFKKRAKKLQMVE